MGWDSYIFTLEDSKHKECSWDCFAFKALCWGTVCEKVVQFFLHLVKCDLYRGQNSLIQQVFVRHCGSHSSATQNRQGFCPPEAPSCGRCLQDRRTWLCHSPGQDTGWVTEVPMRGTRTWQKTVNNQVSPTTEPVTHNQNLFPHD